MTTDNFFHNILENMADGVMVLDFKGRIIMFNSAAGRILGLRPEDVSGKPFAAVFLAAPEPNDEFNQVVLDAIYRKGIGLCATVEYARANDSGLTLSIRSSYLRSEGEREDRGVVLVFSDITEIKALQTRQEEDARKLGQAYLDLEQKNDQLQSALKRVQVIRMTSTILIIALFAGIGLYYFQGDALLKSVHKVGHMQPTRTEPLAGVVTVEQRPLSSSISLSGLIAPLEEIVVTAPFDASIEERHFSFGQMVQKGGLLLSLDASDLEIKLRNARSEYIRNNQKYRELLQWDSGTEMTRARRSLARAKDTLEVNQRKLEESELLFEKGVIPAQELESSKRQAANSLEDVRAAEEELESVREKGGPENLKISKMDLENARVNLEVLEKQMSQKEVRAPVSGVVIRPVAADDKNVSLEKGARITTGMSLLAVGDMDGVIVKAKVDEIDVGKITPGQPVSATGDAFPGIRLQGTVSHISAQASSGTGQTGSNFDALVVFPDIDRKILQSIRVGMSADLEVVVYNRGDATVVPIRHVRVMRGVPTVRLLAADGTVSEKKVQTGITTLSHVEITSGVKPGDRLAGWQQ